MGAPTDYPVARGLSNARIIDNQVIARTGVPNVTGNK